MISLSIVNGDVLAPDSAEPYSFLEWIKRNNLINPDVNVQYSNYKDYIIKWSETKTLNKDDSRKTLLSSYIQVLREIVVSYSTEEEKRFISNADLSNSSDIEIILPFFIEKLKQICLYYAVARENIKYTPIEYGIRGTNFGIEKVVKDLIFSTAQLDLSFDNLPVFFPPLSSIAQDLNVVVEELYDLKDDYFNIAPKETVESSNINNLSGVNLIFPKLYIDFKQAIIDAINQYPFYLNSLGTIFAVNLTLSGNELQYLKNRDFINYLNTGANDNLKINLLRKLAPKYLANDFYYLSTGNTTSEIVSGVLFTVSPLTGAPTLNILNKKYPTVASIPNLDTMYADYQIGRFFLPQNEGILTHITPSKRFEIDTTKLEPNTLYAFPDPKIIGNVSFNSDVEEELIPLTYTVDVTWNKVGISNQYKFGDVFALPYNSLYYGYQSREQDLSLGTSGISRIQDNIDFWTGTRSDIWKNEDIWPGLNKVEAYNNESKQDILLINKGTPVYWASDIYNNEFCLFKDIDNLKSLSGTSTSYGILPGQSTKVLPGIEEEEKSIYEKRNTILGTLYFRDNIKNITYSGTDALSAIFLRYPAEVTNSSKAGFNYFAIYGNTIIAETSSYVVIDQFIYDYNLNQLKLATAQGLFFKKDNINRKLEKFAGEWYSEKENKIYLCFLTLDKSYSNSSYRSLYPKIYSVDLTPLKSRLVYPKPSDDLFSLYSLSATEDENPQIDINKIDGISFEYLLKTNIFNLTYLGKNLNGLPFFINEQIYKNEPFYYTYKPQLFQPFYYINDTNYFTPGLPYFVKYSSSSTGVVGTQLIDSGRLVTSTYNVTGINYMFCDGIKALQLNNIGTYIVHFDWQTYTDVTMFIGCSSFIVRNVDNNLLWNAYTNDAQYLELNNTYNTTVQKLSTPNIIITNCAITKLVDDSSVIKFEITSNVPSFTGLLCDDFNSIYIPITITKAGPGSGRIISDPFCIDCNEKCSEEFSYNTTVTFIASADDYSVFERWEGGYCNLLRTDCIFTVTTAVNLTAYFGKLKIYDLVVTTPASRVISQDSRINAFAGDGSNGPVTSRFRYPEGTIIALSAIQPVSGWAMFGWEGGSCRGIQGDRCSFFIEENQDIFARFVRYKEYPLTISVQSFVQAQSASNDTIIMGADVVYDGQRTSDKFFARYECNRTCTYILTGTNTARYGNQIATLSAKPSPGRKLKYWQGDSSCNDVEFIPPTDLISTIPVPEINRGYSCSLEMDRPRSVVGVFDVGYYTLTLQASGDGVGFIFTELPDPFFKNKIVAGDVVQYSVLSGTTLTIKCSAARGNTFLNLSSRYCPPVDGVSACQIFMDNDVTVVSTITATAFYTLTIINLGTCGIQVTAYPAGRFDTVITCPSGTGGCAAEYPAYRTINIEPVSTNPTCGIRYFMNDPVEENGGLKFRYQAGPGIFLSTIDRDVDIGENLALIDGSIRITPGGAPFTSGTGITVEQKAFVLITDNITITAFPI